MKVLKRKMEWVGENFVWRFGWKVSLWWTIENLKRISPSS